MKKKMMILLIAAMTAAGMAACGKSPKDGAEATNISATDANATEETMKSAESAGGEEEESALSSIAIPLPDLPEGRYGAGFYDTYKLTYCDSMILSDNIVSKSPINPSAPRTFTYDEDDYVTSVSIRYDVPHYEGGRQTAEGELTFVYEKDETGMAVACTIDGNVGDAAALAYPRFTSKKINLDNKVDEGKYASMAAQYAVKVQAGLPVRFASDYPFAPEMLEETLEEALRAKEKAWKDEKAVGAENAFAALSYVGYVISTDFILSADRLIVHVADSTTGLTDRGEIQFSESGGGYAGIGTLGETVLPKDGAGPCKVEAERDADGRILIARAEDEKGEITEYAASYDESGRMTLLEAYRYMRGTDRKSGLELWAREYVYDEQGRLSYTVGYTDYRGNGEKRILRFTYDETGKVTKRTWNVEKPLVPMTVSVEQEFTYDEAGKIATVMESTVPVTNMYGGVTVNFLYSARK